MIKRLFPCLLLLSLPLFLAPTRIYAECSCEISPIFWAFTCSPDCRYAYYSCGGQGVSQCGGQAPAPTPAVAGNNPPVVNQFSARGEFAGSSFYGMINSLKISDPDCDLNKIYFDYAGVTHNYTGYSGGWCDYSDGGGYGWSLDPPSPPYAGCYTIIAYGRDARGNIGSASDVVCRPVTPTTEPADTPTPTTPPATPTASPTCDWPYQCQSWWMCSGEPQYNCGWSQRCCPPSGTPTPTPRATSTPTPTPRPTATPTITPTPTPATVTLSGYVFLDPNESGRKEGIETCFEGEVTIWLDSDCQFGCQGRPSFTSTAACNTYSFVMTRGTHTISIAPVPTGTTPTGWSGTNALGAEIFGSGSQAIVSF